MPRSHLGLVLLLGLGSPVHALSEYADDLVFPPTPVDGISAGVYYEAETGPSGGPYAPTRFFRGAASTEGGGLWAERDNVFCLAYNRKQCGARLLPAEHDFSWTWEASFKQNAASPTLIENNLNVAYVDGSLHRPWAFYVNTATKRANLTWASSPAITNFNINENGNVLIGPRVGQPIRQLEVNGDQLVTGRLEAWTGIVVQGVPACWVTLSTGARVLGACEDF
jgi:hypothetical protein